MRKVRKYFEIGLICLSTAFITYTQNFYRADIAGKKAAETAYMEGSDLYFEAEKATGFLIYPGGKVEETAYAVLAQKLQERGYPVIIVSMPMKLSILNSGKGKTVIERHDEVKEWIIVGHSLGGTSASIFASQGVEQLSGIVFLGSYPYKDLSSLSIKALSLTGTEDGVLNREKAVEYQSYYPIETNIKEIDGGNHAGFGVYGVQKRDKESSISWEEQHEITVNEIIDVFDL